jgi:hypothetical protein
MWVDLRVYSTSLLPERTNEQNRKCTDYYDFRSSLVHSANKAIFLQATEGNSAAVEAVVKVQSLCLPGLTILIL